MDIKKARRIVQIHNDIELLEVKIRRLLVDLQFHPLGFLRCRRYYFGIYYEMEEIEIPFEVGKEIILNTVKLYESQLAKLKQELEDETT